MGDTGSLLIGLVNAILVIKFINVANTTEVSYPVESAPAIGFAILMIPLLDTLRVFAIRIFHRRSPFSPDRNHIHHLLLDRGFSHRAITIILLSINLVVVGLVYIARSVDCTLLIFSVLIFFFGIIAAFTYILNKPKLVIAKVASQENGNGELKTSRVVPFAKDSVLEQKN
jgi:hypothetical protein